MSVAASQSTAILTVCPTAYPDWYQRKHQIPAKHHWPVVLGKFTSDRWFRRGRQSASNVENISMTWRQHTLSPERFRWQRLNGFNGLKFWHASFCNVLWLLIIRRYRAISCQIWGDWTPVHLTYSCWILCTMTVHLSNEYHQIIVVHQAITLEQLKDITQMSTIRDDMETPFELLTLSIYMKDTPFPDEEASNVESDSMSWLNHVASIGHTWIITEFTHFEIAATLSEWLTLSQENLKFSHFFSVLHTNSAKGPSQYEGPPQYVVLPLKEFRL